MKNRKNHPTWARILHNPYPVLYHRWKSVIVVALIVFLILAVFQPFGISAIEEHKLVVLVGFAAVTAIIQLIPTFLLPALFPRYYREQRWTVGKQILNMLLLLLLIGVGNWLYSAFVFDYPLHWRSLLVFIEITFMVGVIPLGFYTLINQNHLLAHHLREAVEINAHLQQPASAEQAEACPVLFQGGTKESLEVNAGDILYVEADGNYIRIVFRKDGKVVNRLLRATMKQAEDSVASCPYLLKCHRAFLVNVRAVVKVNGNSQGYRLLLEGCADEVPVSRAYSKVVKEAIEQSS